MIEVEKKFLLTEEQEKRLLAGAEFMGEKTLRDVYYDDAYFSLTTRDWWLRDRNGSFELKISLNVGWTKPGNRYEELEDEQKIREALNLPNEGNFPDVLADAGFSPFCSLQTLRRKYRKGPFTIDLDSARGENFSYTIAEIELMVPQREDADAAMEKILAFAKEQKIPVRLVRGKILEFIRLKRPEHYWALVRAKVVQDF